MATMSDMRTGANTALQRLGQWVVGLYAWTTAVYLGFVWLDMTYARLVVDPGSAFHTVADVLLAAGAGMVLLGMVAIGLAGNSRAAMKFLIASVIMALLMFPAPALLAFCRGLRARSGHPSGSSSQPVSPGWPSSDLADTSSMPSTRPRG